MLGSGCSRAFFVIKTMQLHISNVTKSFTGHDVLTKSTFSIQDGERVSLVGKNGSGKSTLLKIIAGLEPYDCGTVQISAGTTVGYVPQVPQYKEMITVSDFLRDDGIEEYMVSKALSIFGLEDFLHKKMSELSSGQKTKVYLSRLIVVEPDLLLLDEPTNHLDTEGLEWLEDYITYYPGTVFFVSHDRMFLDTVATKTLELDRGEITTYGGNYSFYKQEKELKQLALERQYISQQRDIKRLTNELHITKQRGKVSNIIKKKSGTSRAEAGFFANRQSQIFGSVAKNIERQIDRIEKIEKPQAIPELRALFRPKIETGESVILVTDVSKRFDENTLFSEVSFHVRKKDRVAIVGNNGSGKSTLIKILMGEETLDTGSFFWGANVDIGYISQEHTELRGNQTVIEELEKEAKLSKTDAYKLLVRFLLPVEKINQSVQSLSSGEKAKVLLSQIMASGPNVLILDEPTNHLDIASLEAIEDAIANYEGTIIAISHDRYFLQRIGITRKLELGEGTLKEIDIVVS